MAKARGDREDFRVSITEVVFSEGPSRHIRLTIDGQEVRIPVSAEVYAYWREQFVRENPTPQQRRKFATVMNILRAAFVEGYNRGAAQ